MFCKSWHRRQHCCVPICKSCISSGGVCSLQLAWEPTNLCSSRAFCVTTYYSCVRLSLPDFPLCLLSLTVGSSPRLVHARETSAKSCMTFHLRNTHILFGTHFHWLVLPALQRLCLSLALSYLFAACLRHNLMPEIMSKAGPCFSKHTQEWFSVRLRDSHTCLSH